MVESTLISVHLLTGFLGSGKTTLLNDTLRSGFGADTAVIINEFGAVGLDDFFVQTGSNEVLMLKNGCVCCTIRADLVSTLLDLIGLFAARGKILQRILIETSGISDPLPILQTLRADFTLAARFRMGAVVCTLGASDEDSWAERAEGLAQLTAADAIVLTKTDLAGADAVAAVCTAATAFNPLAEWVPANGAALAGWLTQQEQRGQRRRSFETIGLLSAKGWMRPAPHRIRSTVMHAPAPASWPQFAVWLTRLVFLHGDKILRTKGLLFDQER